MMKKRIFLRFPEGRAKALTFSYDDNVVDNKKLIEILDRYGMKATFNLHSGIYGDNARYLTEEEVTSLFADSPHEVALHSFSHPFLAQMPAGLAVGELFRDREALEAQFGRIVRGMAYPNNSYNDDVVEALRACGVVYARTTHTTERFDLPEDWLRLPATCHHNNPRLMELADKFIERSSVYAPSLFYVWGHAYEFEDNGNWNVIEEFAKKLAPHADDVWFATNIEIYEYVEAYYRLVFSLDGRLVHNPTARTLYFSYNKTPFAIAPGETRHLDP